MLTVSQLSKSFGGQTLFEDASLQVNRGERIALIGPNGAGKTTLFSILLDLDEADTGEVALQRGVRVGYLPQESAPVGEETVLQVATGVGQGAPASTDHEPEEPEVSFSADFLQIEAKARFDRRTVEVAVRYADGLAHREELDGAWKAAMAAVTLVRDCFARNLYRLTSHPASPCVISAEQRAQWRRDFAGADELLPKLAFKNVSII